MQINQTTLLKRSSNFGSLSPTRRQFLTAPLIGALGVALAGCAGQSATTSNGGELRTSMEGFVPATVAGAALNLMKTRGLDKESGIEIDLRTSASSSAITMAALLSRKADFAMVATQSVVEAVEKGAAIVIVGPVYVGTGMVVLTTGAAKKVSVSHDAPPIERMQALKGMRIATAPPGSGIYESFIRYLATAKLDPDKDVEIVPIADIGAVGAAIKQGTVDAAFGQATTLVANVVEGDATYWMSQGEGDMADLGGGDEMAGVIATRKDVLAAHPNVVEAVYQAVLESCRAIESNRAESGKLLRENWLTQMPAPVFKEMWKVSKGAFPTSGKLTASVFDYFLKIGEADPAKLPYNEFVYKSARES